MWSMLGERNVDMCHWESFGKGWFGDAISHLKLKELCEVREITAGYGELPDLGSVSAPAPSLTHASHWHMVLAWLRSCLPGAVLIVFSSLAHQTNPDHDICFTWNGTTAGNIYHHP